MRPVGSTGAKKTLSLALAERRLDLADTEDKRAKAGQRLRVIERDERCRVSDLTELVAPPRRLCLASFGFVFELIEDLEIKACRLFCGRQWV